MNFNPSSHNYELLLYLPKGVYEFKFIVDNKWRYSSFIPNRNLIIPQRRRIKNIKERPYPAIQVR